MCLFVNQFIIYDLRCPLPDAVHSTYPCHLVIGFEFFGDTLLRCHLFNHPREHRLRLSVNVPEIAVQLAGNQQTGIDGVFVLTQIRTMPLSPDADGFMFRLVVTGDADVRIKSNPRKRTCFLGLPLALAMAVLMVFGLLPYPPEAFGGDFS